MKTTRLEPTANDTNTARKRHGSIADCPLPWADPYISQLWQANQQAARARPNPKPGAGRRMDDAHSAPRGEAPPPLTDTPWTAPTPIRREERPRANRW